MKKSIAVLKSYFKTGDKPTQQQFYDFLESYLHLDSYILASQVTGLETALETLNTLGISDVIGLQTALNDLNTAITTLEVADVSGLQGILDSLAVVAIGDVTGLQAVLDDLATRGIADITGLQDALNGKVDEVAGYGLSQNDFSNYYVGLITTIQDAVTALTYEGIVDEATIIKTLALTDVNKRIRFTNTNPIALTVPLDASVSWYTGTKIKGTVQGSGAVTISGAGITFIGNTLTFPKGESFVLTNTGLDEWTVEGNAPVAGALVYNTYFVNTVTGNNSTGKYEDSSKPYASIDYVLALPAFKTNDTIYLQNHLGTFPLNGTFPMISFKIISNEQVTLDFSANLNGDLMAVGGSNTKLVSILIPNGIIYNNRSGGTGCKISDYPNNYLSVNIDADEIYWNTSTLMVVAGDRISKLKARKISCYTALFNHINNDVEIETFNCLGSSASLSQSGENYNNIITINNIIGTGGYLFNNSNSYIVGNISSTLRANCTSSIKIHFNNSVITNGGFSFGGNGYPGTTIISGNVISASVFTQDTWSENGTVKIINFSGDIGTGQLKVFAGVYTVENSSIKSTNSPFAFTVGAVIITLKNSSFEVVNAVPLCTGGNSSGKTVKIAGISTNATVISDQAGTGVTVTQMTNY